MNWFKRLFKQSVAQTDSKSNLDISRGGNNQKADHAFLAWTSGNLNKMLKSVNKPTNPVDRHFLLMEIVKLTYKDREKQKSRALCLDHGFLHMSEFPSIKPHLIKEMDGILPRVSTYQHIATVLGENGDFSRAIDVCQDAIKLGLQDGTKSGFEGRIKRFRKKMD